MTSDAPLMSATPLAPPPSEDRRGRRARNDIRRRAHPGSRPSHPEFAHGHVPTDLHLAGQANLVLAGYELGGGRRQRGPFDVRRRKEVVTAGDHLEETGGTDRLTVT